MPDKPSRQEDEYFAKQSAEILEARREAAAQAAEAHALMESSTHVGKIVLDWGVAQVAG